MVIRNGKVWVCECANNSKQKTCELLKSNCKCGNYWQFMELNWLVHTSERISLHSIMNNNTVFISHITHYKSDLYPHIIDDMYINIEGIQGKNSR